MNSVVGITILGLSVVCPLWVARTVLVVIVGGLKRSSSSLSPSLSSSLSSSAPPTDPNS